MDTTTNQPSVNYAHASSLEKVVQRLKKAGARVVRSGKDGKSGAFNIVPGPMRQKAPKTIHNRMRLKDVGSLIYYRYGGPIDTDDGEIYLEAVSPDLEALGIPVREWAAVAAPKLLTDPAFATIMQPSPYDRWETEWDSYLDHVASVARRGGAITKAQPQDNPPATARKGSRLTSLSADKIATLLRVTPEERDRLELTTIGALGSTSAKRRKMRKARNNEAKKAARKADGATPREESISATKPWIADGYKTRRTWERNGKKPRVAKPADVANSGTAISSMKIGRPKLATSRQDDDRRPARNARRSGGAPLSAAA